MSDREELDALRRLAELEAKAGGNALAVTPSMRRGEDPSAKLAGMPDPISDAKIPFIAAGRQLDKLGAGIDQMKLSASVAGRQALGVQNGDQLRQLAAMERAQHGNDAVYQPLKEQHPFLTGMGESAFLGAVPMGQATMAGRLAAPVAAAFGNEMLSYGSPKERLMRGAEKGAMAAAGGAVGEGARMLIAPAQSSLSAAQQAALKRASERIGYIPRASELTGNETLRRLEDAVSRQPGGAGPMRDLMDKNVVAVNRHLAKGIGEKADQLSEDVLGNASDRIGQTYNELRGRAVMPVGDDIFAGISKAEKMLSTGDLNGPKKTAFETIQRLKDQLYQSKEFDGATYQAWTSDLAAQARQLGKENRTAAAALREVEKAMDKVARGPDAAQWQATDKQNAVLEMLMRPGVVQGGNASPVKVAGQMERQFGKSLKTGKIQGETADVAELGRYLPPSREGSPTAGREAFGGLPGWMMAAPNYAAAKALTSEFGRDYLSKGLLGNPAVSKGVSGLLGRGAVPMSMAELEAYLLGYQ